MQFGGRYLIGAGREKVWQALNDAAVLRAVIPGCNRIEWVGPDSLVLEIKVNLGLVQPVFTGELLLSDVIPAERYRLVGRGRGGLLGRAEAGADITLADAQGGTVLDFAAAGGASGQIMNLGKALIGHSARRVIDGFFERFGRAIEAPVTPLSD
jgi:carbon monoxide dehydrogenase subunit G